MASPLDSIRLQATDPASAVRLACELEATAPKAGNVHPYQSFIDLTHDDFMQAAVIASECFANTNRRICQRALDATSRTRSEIKTNVNLGILLLLTPLVDADETSQIETQADWISATEARLKTYDATDSACLFNSIQTASAGGLGSVNEMDVNAIDQDCPPNIIDAMRLAKDRDRIALQYATGFRDLVQAIVPILSESIDGSNDISRGIADAHLRLLANAPDSLIARKCGQRVADDVQQRAAKVPLDNDDERQQFDQFLRSQNNRLNPGTTADLIAAALYVLLRTPNTSPN